MVRVLVAISLCFSNATFANETAIPLPELQREPTDVTPNNGDLVGDGNADDGGDRTAPVLAPVVAALVAAGMRVADHMAKQVIKNLSEQMAKTAARNYGRKVLEKKGKNCYSVKASKGDRILLAADKETVIFAGDHNAYMRAIAELCH